MAGWRKSSFSDNGGGNCVEIAMVGDDASIRDTKNRTGGALHLTAQEWNHLREFAARGK